jgi:autotransporter-associated beta strand protein
MSAGLVRSTLAAAGDQYILPVDHFEQSLNFEEIPNVGAVETAPGVHSSAWQHETNPGNEFGGDLSRIYWKVNIPSLPVEPRLYALEWWDATPGTDNDFHVIESIFNGIAGDPGGVNPAVPWGGQFNTNKQWMKTNVSSSGGGLWRQAGGGPQAPSSPDFVVSGGNVSNSAGNPGSNPPVSFMWLKQDSLLFAKWDFHVVNPNGTIINRTKAELSLNVITVAPSTLYWDVNQTTAGAGNGGAATAPSGNWNGTSPNFIASSTGSGPAATRSMTYPVDILNFASGTGATGTYTVTVSGTRYANQIVIEEGNVNFTGGTISAGLFDVAASGSASISSTMIGGASSDLTKSGDGTLKLTGSQNYTGGTTVLAGKLQVQKLHANNPVTISGGTLQVLDSSPTFPSHPSGNDAQVSQPKQLTITGAGTLDLGNNDMIVKYGAGTPYSGSSPAAALEDLVAQGFNGGDWLGTGITSSAAASGDAAGNFVLAIVDNASLAQPYGVSNGGANFDGIDVPLESVLVKFTHRVDLNLDGLVTDADAIIFSTNYEVGADATWGIGDLNYDGQFTDSDAIIFSTYYDTGLAHLPEPTLLGVLGLLGAGLVRRRRTV